MSWHPTNDPGFYPADSSPSGPRPVVATTPFTRTPTSSTLGRMPMTPTYVVPMEAEVVSRADFAHVMLRSVLGTNYLAPISMPSYILDLGCGSGRWVREMSAKFPGARVVGVDVTLPPDINLAISGTYAVAATQARAYAFVQHNLMKPLTFAPSSFDLTHMRLMAGVLPVAVWPRVAGEMVRVTSHGGWVELVESGMVRNGGPVLETIQRWVLQAIQAMQPHGLDPRITSRLAELLSMVGLVDVRTQTVELPVGPHGGRFGELMAADLLARVEGMRAHVLAARLTTPESFARAQEALPLEMNHSEYMQPFYVVCGRR
jgi:SAM-dependent methyltransferase